MSPIDFDAFAEDYTGELDRGLSLSGEGWQYFARGRIQWLARCLEGLQFQAKRILDFGCGTGLATRLFFELPMAQSVLGIDISAKSLAVARCHHQGVPAEFRLADEHTPDGSVDLVFCNGVFHHVPPSQRPQAVRYIADCLRPGGLFALWENSPWNPGTRYVMRGVPFDRDAVMLTAWEAKNRMRQAGLVPLRTDYYFVFPRIARMLRVLEPYLTRLPLGAQYQVIGYKPE
jgi:SAM-dependent methyltransferase